MIILIRSNDANPDPRLQKYINYLEREGQAYKVIAWNRSKNAMNKANYIYFNLNAEFGLRYKNIPKKAKWFMFVISQLIKHKKKLKVIHACDLDTMIPAYVVKMLVGKKVIFDVFDWVSTYENQSALGKIIGFMENQLFKRSDYAILCEKYRIDQVQEKCRREHLVLPNIPDIAYKEDVEVSEIMDQQHKKYKVVLSYVGVFDPNRGLEDMLAFVSENKNYCINIAGFGNLEKYIDEIARAHSNIIYWGKVDYNKGLNIMKFSNLIVSFYYLSNRAHKFAAPNKYYEGLFLGKAILTNHGTAVAEKTLAGNTGFVINEGKEAIQTFLEEQYNMEALQEKNLNAKVLWESSYEGYTQKFMEECYKGIIS